MYDIKFDDIRVGWLAIGGIEDLAGGGLWGLWGLYGFSDLTGDEKWVDCEKKEWPEVDNEHWGDEWGL